jgi:hypothetical protein
MTDATEELDPDELDEMFEAAIDVLALTLPEDAADEHWRRIRELVEERAAEMAQDDDASDDAGA